MNTMSKITHRKAGIARMGTVSGTLVPIKRRCKDTSLKETSPVSRKEKLWLWPQHREKEASLGQKRTQIRDRALIVVIYQ